MGDFDQILNCWLGQFPKGQVPMEADQRIAALTDLFEQFKKSGFEKEYFNNTAKSKITTQCINPNHSNKQKKRKWIEYVAKHLNIAFHTVYKEAVPQEENPLEAPSVSDIDTEVDIEESIEDHNKSVNKKKTPKIEHYSDSAPIKENDSVNEIDPEMALLLGLKIK